MAIIKTDGLEVDLEQFKKMKSMDRDVLIYKNVVVNRHSKFSTYFMYIWLFVLTVAMGLRKFLPF